MNNVLFLIFLFTSHLCYSQLVVEGQVVDSKGNPIKDARIELVNYEFDDVTFVEVSDEKGYFSMTLTVDEGIYKISANAETYKQYFDTKTIQKTQPLTIVLLDDKVYNDLNIRVEAELQSVKGKRQEASEAQQKLQQSTSISPYERQYGEKVVNRIIADLDNAQEELKSLQDSLNTRKINETIVTKRLEEYTEREKVWIRTLQNTKNKIAGLEEQVEIAYMRAMDCECVDFDDDYIIIKFRLVNKNGQPVIKRENVVIKVERKNRMKESYEPLKNTDTNEDFMIYEVSSAGGLVEVKFRSENGFKTGAFDIDNYRVDLYNYRFLAETRDENKKIGSIEIVTIENECTRTKLPIKP